MFTKQAGFSLIELLIVLAIAGVLWAVAYPVYSTAILKVRRTEAKITLLNLVTQMERYYWHSHSYADASLKKLGVTNKTEHHYYTLSLIASAHHYELIAVPNFKDKACSKFSLNELGEKKSMGSSKQCW
ncbi:type IV pilin protein [Rickettsiella massiliensis]|uniref:type IV pilin protein n=1 Tax=Rickettsiella massiliensis TaxID=676517 RepID=UPI00029A0B98|nr:type IV pilin protein [Rickettsiella massiliensis]